MLIQVVSKIIIDLGGVMVADVAIEWLIKAIDIHNKKLTGSLSVV